FEEGGRREGARGQELPLRAIVQGDAVDLIAAMSNGWMAGRGDFRRHDQAPFDCAMMRRARVCNSWMSFSTGAPVLPCAPRSSIEECPRSTKTRSPSSSSSPLLQAITLAT